jgi:hypothetical protein
MFSGERRRARSVRNHFIGFLVVGLAAGPASAAFPQSKQPDFSLIDPVWAAGQVEPDLLNGDDSRAWRALKHDFPQDYDSFLQAYAAAILNNNDPSRISGDFLQSRLKLSILLAPLAPSSALARLQRAKASMIKYLATTDVATCAAFASGDSEQVQSGVLNHQDAQSIRIASEIVAAMFDAVAAARVQPNPRRVLDANDIKTIRRLAAALGGTPNEIDALLSRPPDDKPQRCRLGVLFFEAIAASPDDTSAKFAFR